MSDTLKDLCELLKDVPFTFSASCVSGLIGRETCRCWRCRGVEPDAEESGWARAAELISEGFQAEQFRAIRIAREGRNQARNRKAQA